MHLAVHSADVCRYEDWHCAFVLWFIIQDMSCVIEFVEKLRKLRAVRETAVLNEALFVDRDRVLKMRLKGIHQPLMSAFAPVFGSNSNRRRLRSHIDLRLG